ncbi:MAG: VOC family protein [Alphaproteobacteria bacterium]|nr:VOC family protein [Alphaproteobacteria bacterium]
MSLNTYLHFNGNCREAFEFYQSVFGGEFSEFHTYAEAPADMGVPDAEKDRIMHVSLPVGSSVLMGSDSCSAFGPPPVAGTNFTISILGESKAHCDEMCAKLSDGGNVMMPMDETFWGAYFGYWTDKFGISWMVNYELPKD